MLGKQWIKRIGTALMAVSLMLPGTTAAALTQQTKDTVRTETAKETPTATAFEEERFRYEVYEKEYQLKSGDIYFSIYARYPVMQGETEGCQRINQTLKSYTDGMVREAKANRKVEKETKKLYMDIEGYTTRSLAAEVTYDQDGIFSVLFSGYEHQLGAAHGFYFYQSFTFNTETGDLLSMEQILDKTKKEVRSLLKKEIKKQIRKEPDAFYENAKKLAVDCIKKQPEHFYLTEDGLVYFFQLYEIAPYAAGIPQVTVSLPEG